MTVTIEDLRTGPVVGNAYHDHDLIQGAWDIAIEALSSNNINLAYEALDLLGTRVMGERAMGWDGFDGFVPCLTFWHKEMN